MSDARRRVVLTANSARNILNFRAGLVRGLRTAGYDPFVAAPKDRAEDRIRELGVEWVDVPIDRSGLNPFADVRLLLEYRKLLNRLRPVALLGFTVKPNIYGGLAARMAGTPAIPNISGLGTAFMTRGVLQTFVSRLYRSALGRADTVFFQNPDDRALFIERRIVRDRQARLLPGSGVDLERFVPSALPTGPVRFLFIGRLLGDKGVREFVTAARGVRAKHPEAIFRLLGPLDEGNRTAISRSELQQWLSEGMVEYLGEADDVRPHIERATAVVLPSYREGLPRSLLEAAAMGRPLIATDVPGCREVLDDGVNGLLCAARDSASLAETMNRLARMSSERRAAMGRSSRRMVEERFSETVVIQAYLDALGKLGTSGS